MIGTAYTRNQRYQLSQLAEQPCLTPAQYNAQRCAILDGAEPFGACPDDWVRLSLPVTRKPKVDTIQQILELLRVNGEMGTPSICNALGYTNVYIENHLLREMFEQKLVKRRTIRKQGGRAFLWSAA